MPQRHIASVGMNTRRGTRTSFVNMVVQGAPAEPAGSFTTELTANLTTLRATVPETRERPAASTGIRLTRSIRSQSGTLQRARGADAVVANARGGGVRSTGIGKRRNAYDYGR